MSSPIPAFPRTPAELRSTDATVVELVDAYQRHLVVVIARGRGGAPVVAGTVAEHAVSALAIGQAIVETFTDERWPLVRDALADGVTADAGAAMGDLEVDEIAAGLTSWADREHRAGRLTLDEVDVVVELVAGGAR